MARSRLDSFYHRSHHIRTRPLVRLGTVRAGSGATRAGVYLGPLLISTPGGALRPGSQAGLRTCIHDLDSPPDREIPPLCGRKQYADGPRIDSRTGCLLSHWTKKIRKRNRVLPKMRHIRQATIATRRGAATSH